MRKVMHKSALYAFILLKCPKAYVLDKTHKVMRKTTFYAKLHALMRSKNLINFVVESM